MKLTLKNTNDPFNAQIDLGMTLVVESINRETGEIVIETNSDHQIDDKTRDFMKSHYKKLQWEKIMDKTVFTEKEEEVMEKYLDNVPLTPDEQAVLDTVLEVLKPKLTAESGADAVEFKDGTTTQINPPAVTQ